jgi:hypothetical protein
MTLGALIWLLTLNWTPSDSNVVVRAGTYGSKEVCESKGQLYMVPEANPMNLIKGYNCEKR